MEFRRRLIPENHPEVQKTIENFRERQEAIFDGNALYWHKDQPDDQEMREQKEHQLAQALDNARQRMSKVAKTQYLYVSNILNDARDAGMKQELVDAGIYIIKSDGEIRMPVQHVLAERIAALSNDQVLRILTHHEAAFMRDKELFEKEGVDKLKSDFLRKIMSSPWSKTLDMAQVSATIAATKIELVDGINLTNAQGDRHSAGRYNIDAVRLTRSLYHKPDKFSEVAEHELTHAIFGRSWRLYEDVEGKAPSLAMDRRAGTSFSERTPRFSWLNEAITEKFRQSLRENNIMPGYNEEIEVLDYLMSGGKKQIPFEDFVLAAAEQATATNPRAAKNWRELSAQIREAFSDGFLVRLDNYIKKHGSTAAAKLLKENRAQEI